MEQFQFLFNLSSFSGNYNKHTIILSFGQLL